ncbi:30S ribosome-binding factor RbfA [Candidatus Bipolaricaulota bacterium]|nr:30S ribosome-binding factor RbfA [Candidatus Bipolaricaulota bacterium]
MTGRRARERLREMIKRELSAIVEFEARDPVIRDAFPTVMDIRLSDDARHAKVYVSFAAAQPEREEVVSAFQRDRGFFRSELAKRLMLRYTPELHFILDETVEWMLKIDRLLKDEDDEHQD